MAENDERADNEFSRRDFIRVGAAAGLGATLAGVGLQSCKNLPRKLATHPGVPKVAPIGRVRMGFVGVGMQGSSHVRNFLRIEGVEIKAICDIIEEKVARIQK